MKKIVTCFVTILAYIFSNACTAFFISYSGQMVFGRNYDWMADAGMVCTNQKGLSKTSVRNSDGSTIS